MFQESLWVLHFRGILKHKQWKQLVIKFYYYEKKYIGMVMKVGREEYFHKGGQEGPLWGGDI